MNQLQIFEPLIEAVQQAVKPEVIVVADTEYTTKQIFNLPAPLKIDPFRVHTLGGVVDYLTTGNNVSADLSSATVLILHVESARRVAVYGRLDERRRDNFLIASSPVEPFAFDKYLPLETFIVELQTKFENDAAQSYLLRLVGNIGDEEIKTQVDDGVSQNVTVKTGVVKREEVTVKNPVVLCPLRTFQQISQPASPFIFRLKKYGAEIHAALFEADGGAWELEAIEDIADYLRERIEGIRIIA